MARLALSMLSRHCYDCAWDLKALREHKAVCMVAYGVLDDMSDSICLTHR